jgi:rubrerythrin
MAFNEEKIMELYWAYEKKFPKHAQVWNKLAEEEKTHANMLKSFAMLSGGRELEADLEGITMEGVEHYINTLDHEIKKAKEKELSAHVAFVTAEKIEKGMLEHEIFSVFDSTDKELKNLFSKLEADTRRHYEMVKKLANSVK